MPAEYNNLLSMRISVSFGDLHLNFTSFNKEFYVNEFNINYERK